MDRGTDTTKGTNEQSNERQGKEIKSKKERKERTKKGGDKTK